MNKSRKLVIVGAGNFAEVAYEHYESQSPYEVAAFSVEERYFDSASLLGLPVAPFETVEQAFPPEDHDVFVAILYTELNRARARLLASAKAKGYAPASFSSPHAKIASSAVLGEHCFVFENNVVQPFVSIADNVVLWSGNHIGHHSTIESNVFVSSHVVVAGNTVIGSNCFLGINSAVTDGVRVGSDCWIGAGVTISSDVPDRSMFGAPKATASKVDSHRFFRLKE